MTLFSLKIYSIISCLLSYIKCSLYVDAIYREKVTPLNRLGRWCDENGFMFSPTKTMCVHFCLLRKQHFDPQLYLNDTQIPIIGEAKFIGLIFDSKLSFIPHITSLKSRCTKSLDLIQVLSNTTWGADRKVLLHVYRDLMRSKLDYCCIVYGYCLPTPLTLASGGSPIFPHVVHQAASPASSAVTPSVSFHKSSGDNVVRM